MKIEGLSLDTILLDQPKGTSPFIKNALLTNNKGIVENEPGFSRFNSSVPYPIIGILPIDTSFIVFSTDDVDSEIGIVDNAGTYTQVYNNSNLSFGRSAPVDAEYHRNFKDERIVAWIDDINVPRIINVDDTSGITDVNDLRLFPFSNVPTASLTIDELNGSLQTGNYQLVFRYSNNDGTLTNWFDVKRPIFITDDLQSNGFFAYDGSEGGVTTSKSIDIDLSNVDTRFDNVIIGVIKTINGIVTAEQVNTIPIDNTTISTTYTGLEVITTLTLSEVLTNTASFTNAKAIGQLNNRLYLGNLESEQEFDYQPYANSITLQWESNLHNTAEFIVTQESNKLGDSTKGFMHGEVYAFYIALIFNDGSYSRAFHIPGRAAEPGETGVNTLVNSGANVTGALVYQVEDTTINISGNTGDFGFWQNVNETYPNNSSYDGSVSGPNIAGQQVRHHRFPTIRKCKNSIYSGNTTYGSLQFDKLNINVANVIIPPALTGRVQGYQIFYANRTPNNSTVLGQAPFQFASCDEEELETALGVQVNLHFSDTSSTAPKRGAGLNFGGGNRGSENDHRLIPVKDFIRFGAFDLLLNKPSVNPTYISNQLKYSFSLDNLGSGNIYQNVFNDGDLTTSGIYGTPEGMTVSLGDTDTRRYYLWNMQEANPVTAVIDNSFVRSVSNGRYVPANVIDSSNNIDNRESEETFLLQLENGNSLDIDVEFTDGTANGSGSVSGNFTLDTYLTNIQQIREDVYSSFESQELVATDKIQTNPATTTLGDIFGGDTNVSTNSLYLSSPLDGDSFADLVFPDPTVNITVGRKQIVYYSGETVNNAGLRNQIAGNTQSIYWPKTKNLYTTFNDYDSRQNLVIGYNSDYTKVNTLAASDITIFTQDIEFASTFPHTITRSAIAQTEEQSISWRSFLAGERFVQPRDKGEIINIQGVGNERLLIHQRDSLFITRDRTTIQGTETNATLGAGDIFDLTPQEIVPTNEGFAGTQHRYSCVLTKIGYCFVDANEGKVFVLNGSNLDEISKKGLRNFLRDNLSSSLADNPFNGAGYTMAYDEEFNRLLLTINNSSNSFTASYSPELDRWVSYHEYIPNYMFSTRNQRLYSVNNNGGIAINQGIFRHNIGDKGLYYNSEEASPTPFPLIIDLVFNSQVEQNKLYQSLEWVTESVTPANVYDFNDTFDFITISTNYKTTNRIELERLVNIFSTNEANMRNNETTWSFNEIRNVASGNVQIRRDFFNDFDVNPLAVSAPLDWYQKTKFIDKFIVCRLEYSNLNNNKFYFIENLANFKPSFRS